MNDPAPAPAGIVVDPSALKTIAKGQLRIAIAAIAGALVLRHWVPAWLVNDQTLDLITGGVLLAGASAWSWMRARLTHANFKALAEDPAVPADAVRLKGEMP